jgi:tRNA-modifying protein YgfZ
MADGLKAAVLPNRGVIRVSGDEARGFLDGLVTNTMAGVAPGKAIHAALLTPQGKVIADFFVTEADAEDGGGFYLDTPLINVGDLAKRLGFYKLRARVQIADMSGELGVIALWGSKVDPAELGLAFADPRVAAMGARAIVHRSQVEALAAEAGATLAPADAYHAHRVAHALPEPGFDYLPSEVFPHELNMDQLGGVDFKKGCYVGQEVVSRMEHRGTARTRAVQLAYEGGVTVSEGAPVLAGERQIGKAGSGAAGRGVALIRLDRAAEAAAAGELIIAGGVVAKVVRPDWWTADWPIGAPSQA